MKFKSPDSNLRINLINLKYLLILIFFISYHFAYSQTSCSQQLETATKLYESGQIDKVEALLKPCLEKGFTKDEKAKAYRLLALCKLYYNQDEEAKKAFMELLRVKPEYKMTEFDPTELVTLHKEFRTTPIIIAGVKFGYGLENIYDIENYNDINSIANNGVYTTNYAINAGLSFEMPVIKELSVVYEFYFRMYSYGYKNTVLDYAQITFEENIKSLDIPLMLQWNILSNDFVPYINVGGAFNYLFSAQASYTRNDEQETQYRDPETLELDLTSSRNAINYAICAGVGFRWKNIIGNGYLTLDIRYSKYLNNVVESANRADNPEVIYSFFTTDNTFKIQNTQFMIGYKLPLYKPKYKGIR